MAFSAAPLMQATLDAKGATLFAKGGAISDNRKFALPQLTRSVNILVLGVKVLSTDVKNPPAYTKKLGYQATINSFDGLTDTMLLLRFDPQTQKLNVLSIPRDTRTLIEGFGVTKINEANVEGGPALAAKAVSDLLDGVGIDRYVRINVQGVQALIDALGGVTVYVPKDIKYQDDSQHLYINLKAGKQHLNGDQALQLLRFRYDEYGDIGRIQRQQMVMRALKEQTLNLSTIARLPQILSTIQAYVDTNLSVEEILALTGFAQQTDRASVQMLMVPGSFSSPSQYQASYWLPDPTRIQTMVAQYFATGIGNVQGNAPTTLSIAIQDSTGQRHAVQKLVAALEKTGYANITVDVPWSEPLETSQIVAQSGDAQSAERLKNSLGVGEVRVESTGSLASDITIKLGKDWLQQRRGD
ncbi:LCP family protein (plasmid) [Phormidium sp. CLA17]|nr:LCP family protein [Leptolyngbya sp. Cla-17]